MTGTLLALSLVLWSAGDPVAGVPGERPTLTIDACIAVDAATVREVVELEIVDPRQLPASVAVQCVGDAQEIRIKRSASVDQEDVRTIHIAHAADEEPPAKRQARSRELALAIAELIRWPGSATESPPTPAASELPPPAPVPAPALTATLAPEASRAQQGRWQLGILCTYEHFSGGRALMGSDLFIASRLGGLFLAELRLGARLGADQAIPEGRLATRAATVAAAAGVVLWPNNRVVGGALVLRAQGYLVQFRAEAIDEGDLQTAAFGAFSLALEPRLMVAVTRRFGLQAFAAVGVVPRGIVVRIQGVETQGMSGVALSANLAGVFRL